MVRLGELRLDIGPHDAPDGTLTTCENVRPAGPADRPYYSPVVLPRGINGGLGTIVAIGQQVLNTATNLIVVTSSSIYVVDPASPGAPTLVYTFSAADTTRRAQFSQVGPRVYIAVSNGDSPEAPEILLLLDGTTCRRLYSPPLPNLFCETTTYVAAINNGLNPAASSYYGYRWAWQFKDGTIGPPSQPLWVLIPHYASAADGTTLTFELGDYDSSDNPVDNTFWAGEIIGIAVYMTEAIDPTGAAYESQLKNAPYYQIFVWKDPANHTVPGELYTYTGQDSDIVGGEVLDTGNLWQHHVAAGATFSYNQALILGDVGYDFRKPDAMIAFLNAQSTQLLPGDYGVRLGVTIVTATGTYQRISDPVWFPAASAGAVTFKGYYSDAAAAWTAAVAVYPDARATQLAVYVDDDNDDVYELLTTIDLERGSDAAYNFAPGTLNLTAVPATPAMPDETALNAVNDRDPNRMLVSRTYQPLDMPAELALYVSTWDGDAIMAFAANTVPVSEGQYGQMPLLVVNRWTCKALEIDTTGAMLFSRALPLAERGTVSRDGVTNGEGIVFFASDDGIWTLTPQQATHPLSAPVHAFEAVADILDELDDETTLAYIDDGRGNREVWVGTGSRTWAFSLRYGRWFTMSRVRRAYFRQGYSLYGYDPGIGDLTEELRHNNDGIDYGDGRGTAVTFSLVTRPMTLRAEPGQVRRIYRFAVRQRVGCDSLEYAIFSPVGEGELTADEAVALTTVRTIGAGERFAAVDTLTISGSGQLVVYGDTFVVGSTEGALVAAGSIIADPSFVDGQVQGLCRDVYAVITGKGKLGQGIEALEFDHEPRLAHRPRLRNF